MRRHVTQDGDMVDEIVWRAYPGADQAQAIDLVFRANPGLADRGDVLAAGVVIELPAIEAPVAQTQTRIWG